MQRYLLVKPVASQEERIFIGDVNQNGGLAKVERQAACDGGLAVVSLAVLLVVPVALVRLGALLAFVFALAWFLWRNQHYIVSVLSPGWVVTTNPALVALDRDWHARAVSEPDVMWGEAIDRARFDRLRPLAALGSEAAAPTIQSLRARLSLPQAEVSA